MYRENKSTILVMSRFRSTYHADLRLGSSETNELESEILMQCCHGGNGVTGISTGTACHLSLILQAQNTCK
jgi:hypothetical protein